MDHCNAESPSEIDTGCRPQFGFDQATASFCRVDRPLTGMTFSPKQVVRPLDTLLHRHSHFLLRLVTFFVRGRAMVSEWS